MAVLDSPTADLQASRLQAVVGESWRLRDQAIAELLAGWDGPVKRAPEPDDMESLILSLDTPSLFEPPALYVVSAGQRYIERWRDRLQGLVGEPVVAGALVLALDKLPGNERLARALSRNGCLHKVSAPRGKAFLPWFVDLLNAWPTPIDRPREVAEELVRHRGEDVDGLVAGLELAAAYAGSEPVDARAVAAVVGGEAERPIWEFTDAVLSGRSARAIRLLHAGDGLDPHLALAAVANELRRCLAALVSDDDAEAAALAGVRGRPNLYHTRRRARELGRRCCTRVLTGVLQAQRDLRRSGSDPAVTMELLVVNVQRVIRLVSRP
ncbi:MAG: hypothetical protein ACOCZK_06930 [Planctomycetota bacterium]